jgi:DNA invertase Pin-like site-specific DNA recombinase
MYPIVDECEIIRERVNSGLARAKAQGKKLGRPRHAQAFGFISQTAKAVGDKQDRQQTWHTC